MGPAILLFHGLPVHRKGDPAQGLEGQPGGRDDHIGLHTFAGRHLDPAFGEPGNGVGHNRCIPAPNGLKEITVGDQRNPLPPGFVPGREMGGDIIAGTQMRPGRRDQLCGHGIGLFQRAPPHVLGFVQKPPPHDFVKPLVRQIQRPQRLGEIVRVGARKVIGRGSLHHGHMPGHLGDGRDQRRGRGPGPDHGNFLVRQVQIVRPVLRMHNRPLKPLHIGPARGVSLIVVIIPGRHPQEPGLHRPPPAAGPLLDLQMPPGRLR